MRVISWYHFPRLHNSFVYFDIIYRSDDYHEVEWVGGVLDLFLWIVIEWNGWEQCEMAL